jgi:phosphoenolpyruvate carboxykinase (ATP)
MIESRKGVDDKAIEALGIKNATIKWNLSPEELAEISIEEGLAKRASNGAINVSTGEFTGR